MTDGDGNLTFTWPAGTFTAPPVVAIAGEAGAGHRSARIVSNTAASTVVQAQAAAVVKVIGILVLGWVPQPQA
ncbi:hypothetical protein ACIA8R_08825 [Nonomuraea sp. NPDC051191]|uniref:hypothetical protein n=1 Tax=Nonomuraea sp. NPDC051191 TaxID=3364372 RepID=UPI00378C2B22